MSIDILYLCMGSYAAFWPQFIESVQRNFCTDCKIRVIVFTDQPLDIPDSQIAIRIFHQDGLGWPFATLYRYRMFMRAAAEISKSDRTVFFNANCQIVSPIEADEFFGSESGLLAARHPGYFDKTPDQMPFERRPESCAYAVGADEYFQGALIGGATKPFLTACKSMSQAIEDDLDKGLLAVWLDESHWNAYLFNVARVQGIHVHKLTPAYLYPEDWQLPFEPRIRLLNKSKVIDVDRLKGHTPQTLVDLDRPGSRDLARRLWARMTFGR